MTISGLHHGIDLVPVMLNLYRNVFQRVMVFPSEYFSNRRPPVLLSLQKKVRFGEYKILRAVPGAPQATATSS